MRQGVLCQVLVSTAPDMGSLAVTKHAIKSCQIDRFTSCVPVAWGNDLGGLVLPASSNPIMGPGFLGKSQRQVE